MVDLPESSLDQFKAESGERPCGGTPFVPTDAAFARLPADTLRALRAEPERRAKLLRASVPGRGH